MDHYDEKHGISAMMRTTGYSLSITGQMQARGEIGKAGVFTPDEAIPAEKYIEELGKRGVMIKELRCSPCDCSSWKSSELVDQSVSPPASPSSDPTAQLHK